MGLNRMGKQTDRQRNREQYSIIQPDREEGPYKNVTAFIISHDMHTGSTYSKLK